MISLYRHVNGVNVLSARLGRKHAQNPRAAPHCTAHNKQEKRAVQQSKRNERFGGGVVRTKVVAVWPLNVPQNREVIQKSSEIEKLDNARRQAYFFLLASVHARNMNNQDSEYFV